MLGLPFSQIATASSSVCTLLRGGLGPLSAPLKELVPLRSLGRRKFDCMAKRRLRGAPSASSNEFASAAPNSLITAVQPPQNPVSEEARSAGPDAGVECRNAAASIIAPLPVDVDGAIEPGRKPLVPVQPTKAVAGHSVFGGPTAASQQGPSILVQQVLKAVVKVFTTSTSPNYSMPWQMKHQQKSTASGFVIEGRRILTNAHAVAHHTLVMVRKHGNPKKYVAKVITVGHECDIALMTVDDDDFWEGVLHLELGDVPELQDVVTVVGYPTGGDNVSVTKGVVSRLEIQQYVHAHYHLLAIQIDAAINSGNSGGPALKDEKVIGIAFESLSDADNIGYIIPVPIIQHFLEDVERHAMYTGFCDLGIFWQNMENPDMRAFYKVAKGQSGVLIGKVQPLSPAGAVIAAGDVLMAVDGVRIADDGTVPFRSGERIEFRYLVSNKFADEPCALTVLRDGEVVEVSTRLGSTRPLVPVHLYDLEGQPSYFIYAGLVFVVCSQPFLRNQYGKDWEMKAPLKLCERAASGILDFDDQEAVLLTQVLAHEVNTGYQALANILVTKCNGVDVRNLQHLAQLVQENKEPFLVLDLDKDKRLIINTEHATTSSAGILQQNCIPAAYPADFFSRPPIGKRASLAREAALARSLAENGSQKLMEAPSVQTEGGAIPSKLSKGGAAERGQVATRALRRRLT